MIKSSLLENFGKMFEEFIHQNAIKVDFESFEKFYEYFRESSKIRVFREAKVFDPLTLSRLGGPLRPPSYILPKMFFEIF